MKTGGAYTSVNDVKQDLNDINKRLQGYHGSSSSITDPELRADFQDFLNKCGGFIAQTRTADDRQVGVEDRSRPDARS